MPTDTFTIAASGDDGTTIAWGVAYPPSTQDPVDTTGTVVTARRGFPNLGGGLDYAIDLAYLGFDTSSIPDGAVISSAFLRVKIANIWANADARSLVFDYYDWGASLDSGDFSTANISGSAHAGTLISALTQFALVDLPLVAPNTNINKTGFTRFRGGVSGGSPTGENSLEIYSFDHATEPAPQLIVTYDTPYVVATSVLADTANATTHNVPLPTPAGGILANDILLWIGCVDGNTVVSPPGGWTEIKDEASGVACEVYVFWKRAAGGETGNVTVTTGSEAGGHQILCIRGGHLTTAPAISTGVTSTAANPNPDSLDPAGWAAEDTLWIAAAGNDANVAITAGPAGYSGFLNTRWANTNGAGIATAWKNANATSEDPGAFTMAAEDSRAFTIAIRPAAGVAPVSKTLTATYNIKQQILKTLAPTFNIRKSISKTLTASYNLGTNPVPKTLTASYTIRKAIVKTIPATYFIVKYGPRGSLAYYVSPATGPVQKTLTSTYNIVGRAAKTLSATYNIIKQIPKTLSATYTIRVAITKTLSPSYIIKKSQPKTLSASYNIQRSLLKNVTSSYNIIKQIPKTLSATYNIKKSIAKTLSASYNIGSTSAVPKTLTASYIIKKSIAKTLSATYTMRVSVAKALASSYAIKISIVKTLSPSYQIIQFGTVNKTLSAAYSIQRQIAKTISSTYNIKREIPKTVTSSYNIRVSLPKTLTPTYNIKASIAKSLAASYMVRVSATKVLSASYTIKRATPKTLTPTYTIKNSVSQTLTSAYSVIQFGIVTKTLPVSYNIRISVSKSRSASYMIRRSATKSVTSNYTVIGRIGKTMTAAYIIRTLQIDHFPHSPSGRIAVPSVGRP